MTYGSLREQRLRWDKARQRWSGLISGDDQVVPMEVDRTKGKGKWSNQQKSYGGKPKGKNDKGSQKGDSKGKSKGKNGKGKLKKIQEKGKGKSDDRSKRNGKGDKQCHTCGRYKHFAHDCGETNR
jgi:hypothetical protein